MANASSKRIASQNEKALRGLRRTLLVVNTLTWSLRFVKKRAYHKPFLPSGFPFFLQIVTTLATIAIWRWFVAIGQPKRDSKGGIRVGQDLTSKGFIEMGWDFIYATWICTLGSVLISPKVWWLFLIVPGIAAFKLFGVAQPFLSMFLPGLFGPKTAPVPVEAGGPVPDAGEPGESRKQAKLRARMEKGDKRVQQVQRKK